MEHTLSRYMHLFSLHMITCSARLLSKLNELPLQAICEQVMSCYDAQTNLFSAYPGGDSHVLYTFNALQTLLTIERLDPLVEKAPLIV